MGVLDKIEWIYPPRYGPEWGSGGIFGLKYHMGVLYYMLAFEATAHFVSSRYMSRYRFEKLGSKPVSGGDTYNAVDAVDGQIFFGGWVHAPAIYKGRAGGKGSSISFRNKYSHVHLYDVYDDQVELIWKEGMGHEEDWVGEVSEIIYDSVGDRLLLARADGMANLGIYQIDRAGGRYARLSDVPALKGSLFYDHACFDMIDKAIHSVVGVQCIDLVENKVKTLKFRDPYKISIDKGAIQYPVPGVAAQGYGRFMLFVRGGVFIGNPIDEEFEEVRFYRLFDFGRSGYSPRRTMAKSIGGGVLVGFNAYSEALIYPRDDFERELSRATNTIAGPSTLVYISPPTARIAAAFGARVTGFEIVDGRLLVAVNNMANTSRYDALPIDAGYRGFTVLDLGMLYSSPQIRFNVRGWQVGTDHFGGIPLAGYSEPKLVIRSSRDNRLTIYTYDLSLPPIDADQDRYSLKKGRNTIDLKGHGNSIVSFKLEDPDEKTLITIDLE